VGNNYVLGIIPKQGNDKCLFSQELKDIIMKENKNMRKRYPLKKKYWLKFNVMTYGVLALACRTKESAEQLIAEMHENQLKLVTILTC
jgi:hypothetical protein